MTLSLIITIIYNRFKYGSIFLFKNLCWYFFWWSLLIFYFCVAYIVLDLLKIPKYINNFTLISLKFDLWIITKIKLFKRYIHIRWELRFKKRIRRWIWMNIFTPFFTKWEFFVCRRRKQLIFRKNRYRKKKKIIWTPALMPSYRIWYFYLLNLFFFWFFLTSFAYSLNWIYIAGIGIYWETDPPDWQDYCVW